jgi:hypothetical protein
MSRRDWDDWRHLRPPLAMRTSVAASHPASPQRRRARASSSPTSETTAPAPGATPQHPMAPSPRRPPASPPKAKASPSACTSATSRTPPPPSSLNSHPTPSALSAPGLPPANRRVFIPVFPTQPSGPLRSAAGTPSAPAPRGEDDGNLSRCAAAAGNVWAEADAVNDAMVQQAFSDAWKRARGRDFDKAVLLAAGSPDAVTFASRRR